MYSRCAQSSTNAPDCGRPGGDQSGGGGGGGGWFAGNCGGAPGCDCNGAAGGGGGSSMISFDAFGNGNIQNGNYTTAGNSSSAFRNGAGQANGSTGQILIAYERKI